MQRPFSKNTADAPRRGAQRELHSQGLLWHANCTSNESALGSDRVSSFSLLGAIGMPSMRLCGLTSRLLRHNPLPKAATHSHSSHNGVMYEQQWHAAQPVAGCALEKRGCGQRPQFSIRRTGGASLFSQSHIGKRAALMCAAVVQKVQAGSHSSAWVTRAAQLAGRMHTLASTAHKPLGTRHSTQSLALLCSCAGVVAGRQKAGIAGAAVWGTVRTVLAEEAREWRPLRDLDPHARSHARQGGALMHAVRGSFSAVPRCARACSRIQLTDTYVPLVPHHW